jgi:hypothetical protein
MEEGEVRSVHTRRYTPYPPRVPPPAARERQTNYHWLTLCAVRDRMLKAYQGVYDVHDKLCAGDDKLADQDLKLVLSDMAEILACSGCGAIVPRLDKGCFVAKCGHVYHKEPLNCWDRAGHNCDRPQCQGGRSPP